MEPLHLLNHAYLQHMEITTLPRFGEEIVCGEDVTTTDAALCSIALSLYGLVETLDAIRASIDDIPG